MRNTLMSRAQVAGVAHPCQMEPYTLLVNRAEFQ